MRKTIFVIALLMISSIALADIPKYITVQGRLTDTNNLPVPSASYTFNFSIENLTGTILWSEIQSVYASNGVFNAELGRPSGGINLPFDKEYLLEVWVEGKKLSPRVNITSSGYAFVSAGIAGDLDMKGKSIENVWRVRSPSGQDLWIGLTDAARSIGFYDYVNSLSIFRYNGTAGERDVDFYRNLSMNGNYVCLTNGCRSDWPSGGAAGWAVNGNMLYNNTSSVLVGIGTNNPSHTLNVVGNANITNVVTALKYAGGSPGDCSAPPGGCYLMPNSTSYVVGINVNGTASLEGGIRLKNAVVPPDANYYANNNFISFGHPGASEDFIGYKSNTFYFKDSPGGGDITDPTVYIYNLCLGDPTLPSARCKTDWPTGGGSDTDWIINGNALYNNTSTAVGIGTNSPLNTESWARIVDMVGGGSERITLRSNIVNATIAAHDSGFFGAPAGMMVGTRSAHATSFITNGLSRMTIDSSGNVGIGTATPQGKLEVYGGAGFIGDGSTAKTAIVGSGGINYIESGNSAWTANANLYITGYNANQANLLYLNFANVGIGTPTSTDRLTVSGNVRLSGGVDNYIYMGSGTTTSRIRAEGTGGLHVNPDTGTPTFINYNNAGKTVIGGGTGGNVGIGTDIPASKLDVNGNIAQRGGRFDALSINSADMLWFRVNGNANDNTVVLGLYSDSAGNGKKISLIGDVTVGGTGNVYANSVVRGSQIHVGGASNPMKFYADTNSGGSEGTWSCDSTCRNHNARASCLAAWDGSLNNIGCGNSGGPILRNCLCVTI